MSSVIKVDVAQEYGAISNLVEDPKIEEIWINSPNRIFICKDGRSELTNLVLTKEEIHGIIENLLMWGGRPLDLNHPFVDARLPDGSRLHVAIPEVTAEHWAINIRKHLLRDKNLLDLSELGMMSSTIARFLKKATNLGKNFLISGSTQAGKTTLLNAMLASLSAGNRIITVEEVFELKPNLPDVVALQTKAPNQSGHGEIPLRKLIKEALRMRPSRLVVGENREAESLDLLIALNSGIPGAATIHANSASDAILKIQSLPLLAGENITHNFVAPLVSQCLDFIVHLSIDQFGVRRISEIKGITKRLENNVVESETIFYWAEGDFRSGLISWDNYLENQNYR